jgi:alpha-beta hydrolase superfamily lysophospholipase
MHALTEDAQPTAARRALRWVWRLALALLVLALTLALGFTLFAVSALPPLQPWHTELLRNEFDAQRHQGLDFAGYQRLEAQLFDELQAKTAQWARDGIDLACPQPATVSALVAPDDCATQAAETFRTSRFNSAAWVQRLAQGAPYNRSFRITPPRVDGHALLVHGLTDSPYSMRAMAASLQQRGFEVTVLRLPGHGTLPSMMTAMSAHDWTAAVRLAARDVASRVGPGQPFYVGGYSSGGTLVLQYALDALQDDTLRRPDRVLLVSPAIELTRVAALAEVIDLFTVVPLPELDKARWQAIEPEFDPYKFNSFPVNASRQINRATRGLQRSLEEAQRAGRLAQLPPVVTWQSVVDSTVGSAGVVDRVYARLRGIQHRLVMFDINRAPELAGVARPTASALIERMERAPRGYTLDLVSNAPRQQPRISVRRLAPDGAAELRDTSLAWPSNLVSLGHVALPFPADDPVYGFQPGSGRDGIPSIGSWLLRGENGAITLSLGSLTRLRSNPFWALIDEDVAGLVAQDVEAKRR